MATKQIQELPLGVVSGTQEVPVQAAGATNRLSLATIRDWIMSGWSAVYDPTNSAKNVYDRANHTGVQSISTVTNALNKTGDTMTGVLLLPAAAPTVAEQAASKAYVDAAAGGFPDAPADTASYARKDHAWEKVVPLAGGTMTGKLFMNAAAQITGGLVITSGGMTVAGALSAGANTISGGAGSFSGQVNAANFYSAGQGQFGSVYSGGRVQAVYANGGFDVIVGSSFFSFSTAYSWNSINVSPSNYAIYLAFAGNNHFTFETDRLAPITSSTKLLGTSSQRWTTIYCVNALNVSSDEKLKQDIRPFTPEEVACAKEMKPLIRLFRLKSEMAKEGGGKLHTGMIAQDVESLFAAHGLDINAYAFYEKTEDIAYTTDEEGQSVGTPTGEFTRSLLYAELTLWMIAAME